MNQTGTGLATDALTGVPAFARENLSHPTKLEQTIRSLRWVGSSYCAGDVFGLCGDPSAKAAFRGWRLNAERQPTNSQPEPIPNVQATLCGNRIRP